MSDLLGSVLIANRGEIALRVIRACKELGIRSVLAYSEADANSLPVRLADETVCIGPAQARLSYQNQQALISAAKAFKVDAIHPGYGFLAENPEFAKYCESEGITFVGPASEIIQKMGDKIQARKIAKAAGVSTIPGSAGEVSELHAAMEIADEVGFPLLIKASAGGGGRGMRVVYERESLARDLAEIMAEADAAFGNPAVYIERYLTDIRHIEVQVISDGIKTLHFGERDCTAQRRNQKLVEEAPSPVLTDEVRRRMCEAAVQLCEAVKYKNAGTIEFVYDNISKEFYFIEMNTRIQVEHPVTEMVTGVDLIKLQLQIASGMPLTLDQSDIQIRGHAIECRINAEDPKQNFMPSPGKVEYFRAPGGFGVRMDSHIESDYVIPPYYDSMVGKLICWGNNREEAIMRMSRALKEIEVQGIKTTADFHYFLLNHPSFLDGEINTSFVAKLLDAKEF
ncbi:acetyl-CoA carboxylase biotin carboxylase subunit [Orrella sp. 11846]|uniref:acetyl-CoA carboxylase biotin carboxylase subunit n=1 Tax=Orrella sp. 11846 TaxID=3409913 RepID=UPI003B5ACAD5